MISMKQKVNGIGPVGFGVHVEKVSVQSIFQEWPSQNAKNVVDQCFRRGQGRRVQQVGDNGRPVDRNRPPGTKGKLFHPVLFKESHGSIGTCLVDPILIAGAEFPYVHHDGFSVGNLLLKFLGSDCCGDCHLAAACWLLLLE